MNVKALVTALIVAAAVWKAHHRSATQQIIVIVPRSDEVRVGTVVASSTYRYDAPPSITREKYVGLICEAGPACNEAGGMYDVLVAAGLDPVVEAAQAAHETSLGTAGVGRPGIRNLHGVQCHPLDGRIGDSRVPWGNGCAGVYATYTDSVRTWAKVILEEYVAIGLNTPALAVSKYAPTSDGNDVPRYIHAMERLIDQWRAEDVQTTITASNTPTNTPIRTALVDYALALRGIPYVRGGRSASGGDCSGTMQYIFETVASVDIGGTTYSQQDNPNLLPIDGSALRPGDLWYGQYADDQHTGMVADVDNDGTWDLINNGGLQGSMHVDYNFMANPYFNEHTIGFRTVLGS